MEKPRNMGRGWKLESTKGFSLHSYPLPQAPQKIAAKNRLDGPFISSSVAALPFLHHPIVPIMLSVIPFLRCHSPDRFAIAHPLAHRHHHEPPTLI